MKGIPFKSKNVFISSSGRKKFFIAKDYLFSPDYKVFSLEGFLKIIDKYNMKYDWKKQKGVVFHMISSIQTFGRIGLTVIGNSEMESLDIYEKTVKIINEEAKTHKRD